MARGIAGLSRHRHGTRIIAAGALLALAAAALVGVSARRNGPGPSAVPSGAASDPARRYPFTYVAIGASDSYGVGVDNPATESWPAVLASRLPAGTHFVNLGVPGILLSRAVEAELPIALDAHPNLVTVWLAVNDLAAGVPLAQYSRDLDRLLTVLQRGTSARVLIANLPDLTLVPTFAGRPGVAATLGAWNAAIAAAARAHGAVLVDLYAHWRELAAHPEYVGPDGLHPSVEGYRRLADVFWQAYVQADAARGS